MSAKTEPSLLRILVVDDHFPARYMLTSILSATGYDVIEAENGEKALRQLEASPVDMLITDVHMPLMDGIALTAEVRLRFPSVYIMVISSDDLTSVSALEAGAHLFLAKPFAYAQLMEAVAVGRVRRSTQA